MGNLSLVGGSNQGISPKVDSQRSINWMPRKPERQGDQAHLRGRPGLDLLCEIAGASRARFRGVHDYQGRSFCVFGSKIYEIYANGDTREWGRIASVEGKVTMASLLDTIVIGDGSGYYALNLTEETVSTIVDAPRGRFCVFFNQRILYQGENGQVYYSELNDPTNIPGLNFFTAESLPDEIVAITTSEDMVYLHGEDSTEPVYDSGDSDNPFQRVQGGVMHSGCAFPDTAHRVDNSSWWVERDKDGSGIVRRTQGSTAVRVSTSAVERWLSTATNVAAHTYQEEGHLYYRLTADQGPCWTYDLKEQEWFEEAWLNPNRNQERHRAEFHVHAFGYNLVFDYANGKVYKQSLSYHSDDGQEIRRTRVSAHSGQDGRQVIVDELFLDFATGVGLDGEGQGTDPEVMLRVSKDGATWGNERTAKLGGIGKFRQRVRFHRLGLGTDFLLEISVSDPVLSVLMSGDVVVRHGRR
jgi:quinol monooxygenase YgiN